jgi:SAM-dependent methyltransferase
MNHSTETIEFYDAVAPRFFTDWFDNDTCLPVLRELAAGLPPAARVLDLGCGTGGESRRLAALGCRVTGVDLSEASLAYARRHVPEASFRLMDIRSLDFPAASFDGLLEAGVLFHFPKAEQATILAEIARCLTPEGRFLSIYRTGDFEGMEDMPQEGRPYRRYARKIPAEVWIAQVEAAGFRLEARPPFPLPRFEACLFRRDAAG